MEVTNSLIEGITVKNIGGEAILHPGRRNHTVRKVTVDGANHAINSFNQATNVRIIQCNVISCRANGVYLEGFQNAVVSGCHISAGSNGIVFQANGSLGGQSDGGHAINNRLIECGSAGIITSPVNATVNNITITNNELLRNGNSGIRTISGVTQNVTVLSNYAADNGQNTSTFIQTNGISIQGSNVLVANNRCVDTAGGSQVRGIALSGLTPPITLFNNDCRGTGGGFPINDRDGGKTLRFGNLPSSANYLTEPPTAANERQGQLYFAGSGWDPDGDGNAEVVVYDGTAFQEVVDLPNF